MNIKRKSKRLRHITFNLIDLACLIVAFFLAYYIKFGNIDILINVEWPTLLVLMCLINIVLTIIERTYIGILKRRYYQQFKREITLILSQLAVISVVLFSLKVGAIYSRQIVFTTYLIYFLSSQMTKYFRKKFLTGEFSFSKDVKIAKAFQRNTESTDYKFEDNRSGLHKFLTDFTKRSIDIIAAIIGCIILVPLTLFVFIINKLSEDDDGPVFYLHERVGKNGKIFKMIKYRSMVVDADEKLKEFLEENEEIRREFEINRKIKNDPRVTRIGKFLRKTSLDEFPQFINVLIGDMSLVGPRAVVEDELKKFGKYKKYVFSVKPGITGNWAANGRSDTTYEERVKLECEYVEKYSIRNDIKIIFKTIISVIKKEGAV